MESLVWTVAQLIVSLMLPPAGFLILLAVALSWGGKHRWGRWLAVGSLAALALLSLNAVGHALVKPFEDLWPPFHPKDVAALAPEQAMIVVLGGGRISGALEYPEHETLAAASLRRTVYAAQLSARTGLPLAVSGGRPGGGSLDEAELMKNLLENGFKQRVTLVENGSFNTHQNALYMAKALAGRNIRTVVLVTDVTHMPRAARAFEAAGLNVVPAPVNFHAAAPLKLADFVPSTEGLELSRNAVRELVGALWYHLRRATGD